MIFKRWTSVLLLFCINGAVILFPVEAAAQSFNGRNIVYGTVISATGCHNRFTVNTRHGYSIIEYLGGQPVVEQDLMDGDMETIGYTKLVNKTQHATTNVFVEQSHLSVSRYLALRRQVCH